MKRIWLYVFIFFVFFVAVVVVSHLWAFIMATKEPLAVYDGSGAEIINYYPIADAIDTQVSNDKLRYDANNDITYHLPYDEIAKQYHVGMFVYDGSKMRVSPWQNYLNDVSSNRDMFLTNQASYVPTYVDSVMLSPTYGIFAKH